MCRLMSPTLGSSLLGTPPMDGRETESKRVYSYRCTFGWGLVHFGVPCFTVVRTCTSDDSTSTVDVSKRKRVKVPLSWTEDSHD